MMNTVVVLAAIVSSVLWMSGKFGELEKDVIIIKTVLVMQRIMPCELAKTEKGE
jgi:hypothetical protein